MRHRILWLALVLTMTLALVGGGDGGAQQPRGKKKGGKGGFGAGFRRAPTVDQLVERIMTFDKNKDGKITGDELPERMQHLVALGDTNKDGVLDKDEVRKLATTLESFVGLAVPAGPRGGPFGGPGRGGPRRGAIVQRALDDLSLSANTKEKAAEVVKAHLEKVRRLEDLARAELLVRMKEVLSEQDFKTFRTAVDRPPGPPRAGAPKSGNLETTLDRLQKELDDLRRSVQK